MVPCSEKHCGYTETISTGPVAVDSLARLVGHHYSSARSTFNVVFDNAAKPFHDDIEAGANALFTTGV
jgi:hypothetical protein